MNSIFYISQNDTLPILSATLQNADRTPIDLTNVTSVILDVWKNRTVIVSGNCTITDAVNGRVSYAWQTSDTQRPGTYQARFRVTFSNGAKVSVPNNDWITIQITDNYE